MQSGAALCQTSLKQLRYMSGTVVQAVLLLTWEDNGDCQQHHNMAAACWQLVQQLEHLIVGAF